MYQRTHFIRVKALLSITTHVHLFVLMFLLLTGCAAPSLIDEGEEIVEDIKPMLHLHLNTLAQDQLSGTFQIDHVGKLEFNLVEQTDGDEYYRHLVLAEQEQGELIRIEARDGVSELSVLGGEYKLSYQAEDIDVLFTPLDPEIEDDSEFNVIEEGNPEAVNTLLENPNYIAVPLISRTLGESGVDGSSFPVASYFHMVAMNVHQHLLDNDIQSEQFSYHPYPSGSIRFSFEEIPDFELIYDFDGPEDRIVYADNSREGTLLFYKSLYESLGLDPFLADNRVAECESLLGEGSGDVEIEEPFRSCITPPLPDRPCTEPDEDNDCFGKCGPGCECWKWVCRDSCSHPGCRLHDWAHGKCNRWLLGCVLEITAIAAPIACGE